MAALLAAGLVLSACEDPNERQPLTLAVTPGAAVWPAPPQTPRYAFVRTLVGEQDFLTPEAMQPDGFEKTMRFIAGLVTGPRRFRELQRPVSGMTGPDGTVYVIDNSHKGVVVFDSAAKDVRFWLDSSPGHGFEAPVAMTSDGLGGFLVTDADLRVVVRLSAGGAPVSQFGVGLLRRPTGVARDPATGHIFVADSDAHDIKVFDGSGNLIETLGGPGVGEGEFNRPTHLTFAGDSLYVADTFNFRIQVFDRAGDGRLTFGRLGLFVGNMQRPKGVAVGGEGRIYVIESLYDHMLVFNPTGEILLALGGTGPDVGSFYLPSGVWTDDRRRVYVADMFNGRVVVFQELTGVDAAALTAADGEG